MKANSDYDVGDYVDGIEDDDDDDDDDRAPTIPLLHSGPHLSGAMRRNRIFVIFVVCHHERHLGTLRAQHKHKHNHERHLGTLCAHKHKHTARTTQAHVVVQNSRVHSRRGWERRSRILRRCRSVVCCASPAQGVCFWGV